MTSSAPTQFSRHRRTKSYPPREPPSSGITFTLSDHLTSCFTCCFACFPSSSRRSPEDSLDEVDFPRDTLDSLLPSSSSEHGYRQRDADDDVAAWGSDALSLRSQFGTSNRSSRERNPRGLWRSWLGRLIAGRGQPSSFDELEEDDDERDFLEDPVMDWQVEDQAKLLEDNEVDWEGNVDSRPRIIDTPPDRTLIDSTKSNRSRAQRNEGGEEEEGEWGAFLSAPLSSRLSNSATSPSSLLSTTAYPFPPTEPALSEGLKPPSISDPFASSSSSSSSTTSSSTSKHRSSRSSKKKKKKSPPSLNETVPSSAKDLQEA